MSQGSLFLKNKTHKPKKLLKDMNWVLEYIFPPVETFKKPERDWENAIQQFLMLLYGKPGSGKTETIRWLVEQAIKKYGEENVNVAWSKGDMQVLLEEGIKDKLINILYVEDATDALTNKSSVFSDYFQIRHKVKEKTGRSHGYVMVIIALHDYFGIPKKFRNSWDLILFKSAPTNKYDRDFFKGMIGENLVNYLAQNQILSRRQPSRKAYGIFYTSFHVGKWKNPMAKKDYLGLPIKKIAQTYSIQLASIAADDLVAQEVKHYKDELFFKLVIKNLTKYADPHNVELFARWLNGEPQRILAYQEGIKQSTLSERFKRIREDGLGYAGEDAYSQLLTFKKVEHIRGGANTDEPDFILPREKIVISFKTYVDPKLNLKHALTHIGKKERELARQGYILYLVIFEMLTKTFYVYQVEVSKQSNQEVLSQPPSVNPSSRFVDVVGWGEVAGAVVGSGVSGASVSGVAKALIDAEAEDEAEAVEAAEAAGGG